MLTRFDPLTDIVSPMRPAVFSRLSVPPAAMSFLAPNVTWAGWQVPIGLSLGMVAMMGAVLLGVAIAEFQKTE